MESSTQCNLVFGTHLIFVAVIRRVSNDHSGLRKISVVVLVLSSLNRSFRRGTTILVILN